MKKLIITSLLLFTLSCSSNKDFEKGKRILEGQGYTKIHNTGYKAWCCDSEETYATGFTALDKDGKLVVGCFCSKNFKGITIRYE